MNGRKIIGWGAGVTLGVAVVLAVIHVVVSPSKTSTAVVVQRPATSAQCPGEVGRKILTEIPIDVSKNGNCLFVSHIGKADVLFIDGMGEYKPAGGVGRNPMWAKAVSGNQTIYGSQCPLWRSGMGELEFDCTKKVRTATR